MVRKSNRKNNAIDSAKEMSNLNAQDKKVKGKKKHKNKNVKAPLMKSVMAMTRDELIKTATSTAQHANKTLRDYERAGKEHLYAHGRLLSIAEDNGLKTRGNRVSRSFKNKSDNELRDFITDTKVAYTGKNIKKASEESSRQRLNAEGTIKDRFSDVNISKLKELSDSDFNKVFNALKDASKTSKGGRQLSSDEVIQNELSKMGLFDDDEDDSYVYAFQKNKEMDDRLNKNKVINRNKERQR
jgi:hypothetical protein